jgi:hypothetical protein
MTVVAAVSIFNVPVLMSDIVITDESEKPSVLVPTRIHTTMPAVPRRVSDLRRKCVIVNDRFAVAFTGHVSAGKRIIDELILRFGNSQNGPTMRKLDKILHPFTFNLNGLEATLVGWTVHDRRPVCFKFTAALRSEVTKVKSAVAGSGERIFSSYLNDPNTITNAVPGMSSKEKAIRQAIWILGRTQFEEVCTDSHLINSFGGGVELAFWDGRRFAFVRKMGFWPYNVLIRGSKMYVEPSRTKTIYEDCGNFSVIAAYRQYGIRSQHPDTIFTQPEVCYLYGLLPLNFSGPFDKTLITEPPPDCDYYFCGFAIINEDTQQNSFLGVSTGAGDGFVTLTVNDDVYNTSLPKQAVQEMVQRAFPGVIWD